MAPKDEDLPLRRLHEGQGHLGSREGKENRTQNRKIGEKRSIILWPTLRLYKASISDNSLVHNKNVFTPGHQTVDEIL